LSALLSLSGCYEWVAIKPTEVPRAAAGERDLEQPDGRHAQLGGTAGVVEVVTPRYGATFWTPRATIEDEALTISSGDEPPAAIPLSQITDARAGRLQPVETVASILVGLAAAGLFYVIVRSDAFHFPGP